MTGQENKRPNELIEHAPVTLRRFRVEDVDALFQAVTESLDELRPWMPWAADYSRASAEEYLASGQIPRKLGFTEAGRRPLDMPTPSGTGTGVVWRLTR
jgi:hypothetical protein